MGGPQTPVIPSELGESSRGPRRPHHSQHIDEEGHGLSSRTVAGEQFLRHKHAVAPEAPCVLIRPEVCVTRRSSDSGTAHPGSTGWQKQVWHWARGWAQRWARGCLSLFQATHPAPSLGPLTLGVQGYQRERRFPAQTWEKHRSEKLTALG